MPTTENPFWFGLVWPLLINKTQKKQSIEASTTSKLRKKVSTFPTPKFLVGVLTEIKIKSAS